MPRDYPIDIPTTVRTARNLKPGDVVKINWFHEYRVENRKTTEVGIEFLGELRNKNDEWRVLTVETNRLSPPVLTTPAHTEPIVVVDIKPIDATLVSSQLAWQWMHANVSVDHAYRARRIEVSTEKGQKVGECPVCSEPIYLDEGKNIVGCRDCGVWVEKDVWIYWSKRSQTVEYDPKGYETDDEAEDDSNNADGGTLEYWVQD